MSIIELILKVNGKFPSVRKISQSIIKNAVINSKRRVILNSFYHKLTFYEKSIFHALFSRIFRDGKRYEIDGVWVLKFAGKEVRVPLETDSLWLDWETAVSVLGHDYEIKQYYESRILSDNPPKYFLDIGANYGTHSLLFLSAGIQAISIEPNPECKAYFERMLSFNHLEGDWNAIGLGKQESVAELVFPDGETWLGSLKEEFHKKLIKYSKLKSFPITIKTLDDFLNETRISPNIIKIDTEGFEVEVIEGGKKFLSKFQPEIIFEANTSDEQERIFELFKELGFQILSLKNRNLVRNVCEVGPKEQNFLSTPNG